MKLRLLCLFVLTVIGTFLAKAQIYPNSRVYTTANSGIPSNKVTWVTIDQNNIKWLSTDQGLAKFNGSTWTVYNSLNSGLPVNNIGMSVTDAFGDLWIASNVGLIRFNGTAFTVYNTTNSSIPSNKIICIARGLSNSIWVGTEGAGTAKFDGSAWQTFNAANAGIGNDTVTALKFKNDTLWMGHPKKVTRFKGTSALNIYTTQFQNASRVTAIESNSFNQVVFSMNTTIFQTFKLNVFSARNLPDVGHQVSVDNTGETWHTGPYSTYRTVGTVSSHYAPGGNRVAFDSNNNLWIATDNGLKYHDRNQQECFIGNKLSSLNVNNLKVNFSNDGSLFAYNSSNGQAGVMYPRLSSKSVIFNGSVWVSGFTPSGQRRVAARVQLNNRNDFWTGPIDHFDPNDTVTSADCIAFNRIWKIRKSTVDSFVNGTLTVLPLDFKEWPARNNPLFTAVGNRDLAPFVDVNKDYKYSTADGDYPLIKGDQAVWWVLNDAKGIHMNGTPPIGLEMQTMAYEYNIPGALYNTAFYEVKLCNKSDSMLTNTNFTIFADGDLGRWDDDFIGTDSTRNMGIFYNGDNDDEGYFGTNIPMAGISMIRGPKDEFREPVQLKGLTYFNNSGMPNALPYNKDPNGAVQIMNYQNSIWADTTHMTFGGSGHGGTQYADFLYPSDPADPTGWSECTAGNQPNDKRLLITFGEFNMIPDQYNAFTFAVVIKRDNIPHPCPSFAPLQSSVDSVKTFFDTNLCSNFSIQITDKTNSTCTDANGSAAVFATGGNPPYFYDWTNGSTDTVATGLSAGIYVITVTDVMGCSEFITFNITDTDGPQLSESITAAACDNVASGSINLTVNSGSSPYEFLWSTGATTSSVTALPAGPHEVTVTDASDCKTVKTIVVGEPLPIQLTATVNATACSGSTGSIDLSVSGGNGPYTYSWSPGQTTQDISGLAAGVFKVKVTDAQGCVDSLYSTVNSVNGPVPVMNYKVEPACSVLNGSIEITTTGGTQPYNYSWSNGSVTEDISTLGPGSYSVKVTDNNGCLGYLQVSLANSAPAIPGLCLVSVDSIYNTNLIGWEKDPSTTIDHYNIYRESSTAGIYYKVGEVDYDSLSVYVDSLADPNIKSWRYKLSATNDCGIESGQSTAQKTIHLSINRNNPSAIGLVWDHYEGFPFNEYHIWRWKQATGWQNIAIIPNNYTYYYDFNTLANDTSSIYNVIVVAPSTCNFDRAATSQNVSRSNKKPTSMASGFTTAIAKMKDMNVMLFPNPNNGSFKVTLSDVPNERLNLDLYSVDGRIVARMTIDPGGSTVTKEYTFDELSNGMYLMKVSGGSSVVTKSFIISR